MTIPTIFETCLPRADILSGSVADADFAADLAQVIRGHASEEYAEPARFFARTWPTRGLKNLLANVCRRLSGAGGEAAAIFRLDTSYGGGKTHALIALVHTVRGARDVGSIGEFVDPSLLPEGPVRVAAFDGENADPANGRAMGDGVLARTPWGEIAYALAGKAGYERVRNSDERGVAPGAETLRELFGGQPALILLDELSVYLRKVQRVDHARDQLSAFLTSLFKAVESEPKAALVYTRAIGKDGRATDAYSEENQFIGDRMAEVESVSARKATLLNPTEEDETIQVLRRRLFDRVDSAAVPAVVAAYQDLWTAHGDALVRDAVHPQTAESFRASYPLHPEVLETLTGKTATLGNFQRVRGMLRLLARTIAHLWKAQPADATAIHLHHIDPGHEPIRQEIVTRLGQTAYLPAIANDVAGGGSGARALAQEIDAAHHGGMPPYAAYVARTIFMHTLAFNDPLKGVSAERLRYSVLGPATDISFIDQARKRFVTDSAYLDDRPRAPMRFLAEANLRQIIRREEQHVDAGDARAELDDRIRRIFSGKTFETISFPGGPFDVPDEVGDGRPRLIVLSYDGVAIGTSVDSVPELVERIHTRRGADGAQLRALRNNLVFVVADDARKEEMRRAAVRRLALLALKRADRLADLAEHQQEKIRELEAGSEHTLAIAIQQCYRHIFYPSRNRIGASGADLDHSAIDLPATSDQPGAGQQQVVRALRELRKLRLAEDEPDSPTYVRDRTPLRRGQMTTLALREEFRRDPALPIMSGDDIFVRGIRRGVEQGDYIYRCGELLCGPGDPAVSIMIDEQTVVLTMEYARNRGIWPRPERDAGPDDYVGETKQGGREDSHLRDPGSSGQATGGESPPGAPAAVTAEGVLRGRIGATLGKGARAAYGKGTDALDPHVRGRRCIPAAQRHRRGVRGEQGGPLHRRLRNPRRGFVLVGVHRTVRGCAAGQGVSGTATSCRSDARPGSRVRADIRKRAADARRCRGEAYRPPVAVRERGSVRIGHRGATRVMVNAASIVPAKGLESAPQYELRVRRYGPADTEYAIWQIPSSATPHLTVARGVARLRGSNLDLIEHRVLRRLAQSGVRLGPNAGDDNSGYPLPEEVALLLGLLFRALAPMRNRANMRDVVEGIETMRHEEAAYWAGMAIHRRHPRRVLMALRILLTDGATRSAGTPAAARHASVRAEKEA